MTALNPANNNPSDDLRANDISEDISTSSSGGTFLSKGTEAKIAELIQDSLKLVPFSPQLLIDVLKLHPRLEALYEQECPYPFGYRNDHHAHAVLSQFDRYFADRWSDVSGFTKADMRITLALHDIGKFLALPGEGQHSYTIAAIDSVRPILPMTDSSFAIMKALIDGDPLGTYFKKFTKIKESPDHFLDGGDILPERLKEYEALAAFTGSEEEQEEAAREASLGISASAGNAGISTQDFHSLLIQYFQSDSSSYSIEADLGGGGRAHVGLEAMYAHGELDPSLPDPFFIYDEGKGRLLFSPKSEEQFSRLEAFLP